MNGREFVLEFVVSHISCKNLKAANSPLIIKIPGCAPIELSPRTVTLTRISYEKGKRLIFGHERILDLNTKFELLLGHGNPQVRGKCQIDFFEVAKRIDEKERTIYEIESAMQRPDGSHLGVLYLTFQIFPVREFEEIRQVPKLQSASGQPTSQRVIVRPMKSSRNTVQSSNKGYSVKEPKTARSPRPLARDI